jgi:hypothetical protein
VRASAQRVAESGSSLCWPAGEATGSDATERQAKLGKPHIAMQSEAIADAREETAPAPASMGGCTGLPSALSWVGEGRGGPAAVSREVTAVRLASRLAIWRLMNLLLHGAYPIYTNRGSLPRLKGLRVACDQMCYSLGAHSGSTQSQPRPRLAGAWPMPPPPTHSSLACAAPTPERASGGTLRYSAVLGGTQRYSAVLCDCGTASTLHSRLRRRRVCGRAIACLPLPSGNVSTHDSR